MQFAHFLVSCEIICEMSVWTLRVVHLHCIRKYIICLPCSSHKTEWESTFLRFPYFLFETLEILLHSLWHNEYAQYSCNFHSSNKFEYDINIVFEQNATNSTTLCWFSTFFKSLVWAICYVLTPVSLSISKNLKTLCVLVVYTLSPVPWIYAFEKARNSFLPLPCKTKIQRLNDFPFSDCSTIKNQVHITNLRSYYKM